jgi:hypothetical protein
MNEGRYQYEKPIRVVKNPPQEERSRSEYTLLWELIQRNPERAKEFLRRLDLSCKPQDVVITS